MPMALYKLSPSSLNLMNECPRCFWLDKHNVWQRPDGIFPSLPSGMDSILKKHFDRFREKGELPPEIRNNEHTKGLKLFNDTELLKIWRNNTKGIRWSDEQGNVLSGAVDDILVKDKKLIVFDYKTRGFSLKKDTADHYQNQLDIYNLLLRKNNYETEDYAFLLFYYPKDVQNDGMIAFHNLLVRREVDVKNAQDIFDKGIKILNGDCPKESC